MKDIEMREFIGSERIENKGKVIQRKKWYKHKLGRRKSNQEIIQIHKDRVLDAVPCKEYQ